MALADDLEVKVVSTLATITKLTELGYWKGAVTVGIIWGIAILRLADAVTFSATATKDAANQLPKLSQPGPIV